MIRKEKITRIHEIFTNRFASKKLYPQKMSKKKTGAKRKTKKATETQKSGVNLRNLVVAKFHKAEKAQSMALGFVIIMGILLTSAIIFLSMEIPKQTKILEAEHAAKVPQDFAELVSVIDGVALSGDETASATCAIGMVTKHVPFVGIQASGGTLRFDNSSERFECLAYAPGEPIVTGSGFWNCAPTDFGYYDKYHVDTFPDEGAKLQLGAREDKIYVSGKNESLSGEFWFNNFTVTNGTTLTTHLLTIHARNITIGQNSSINADSGGLAGGKYTLYGQLVVHGKGKGRGKGTNCNSTGGGGAGHNGTGGDGGAAWDGYKDVWYDGGEGGSAYGSATNMSADFGSGGAGGTCSRHIELVGHYEGGYGGNGGGVIFLGAPVINIIGNVSSNGGDGLYSGDGDIAWDSAGGGGGGGSGGTILLNGGTITIYGCLSVKGGNGADGAKACDHYASVPDNNGGGGGGGSGGRLKIFNDTALNFPASDNLADHINVSGGASGLGGIGPGIGCTEAPTSGGDGTAGENGSIYIEKNYTELVPHYPAGYLISNVTATEGHIGHNNTENTSMVRYGIMTWAETRPSGTNIYLKVRTSRNADMTDAMSWENSPPVTNGQDISDLASVSDGHRYIQWRADLYTLERSRTPILKSVNISYEYGLPVVADCTGNIEFSSHYLNLPNYKLVYEHGATIKNQTSGEFMLHTPPITISKYGNTTALKIYSVDLTGDDETASGVFSSAVKASYKGADLVTGGLEFHNITLNITTEYPTAWSRWFNKTCEAAGLVYGTAPGNYNLSRKGNPLQIMFYGNESRPVNLWLKESEVGIEVEG